MTAISIKTPNRALDTLVNHWLLYQTLSCRVWGRSAFYQAGSAYGYRDQLQDSMALVYSLPNESRRIILQAASRQFEAGDVQHWWHPPTGRGVRTRFADDYLWLPLVTSHYVMTTGDSPILNEVTSYLHSLALEPHEEERYELPDMSSVKEDLISPLPAGDRSCSTLRSAWVAADRHRRLERWLKQGRQEGQGESVWMALVSACRPAAVLPIVEGRGDAERANVYRGEADRLLQAVEARSLGRDRGIAELTSTTARQSDPAENDECQIDSLAQSWAVLAGADPQRANQAMRVRRRTFNSHEMIDWRCCLTPPFDKSNPSPGTSKAICRASAKMAASTHTRHHGSCEHSAAQGRGTQAVELFDLLNPFLRRQSKRRSTVIGWNLTSWRPTSTATRNT